MRLGNLALFLPFGYLGMAAWLRPPRPLRFVLVVGLAAAFAAALQWAQLFLPSRHPVLRDALPNVAGAALGALAACVPALDPRRFSAEGGVRPAPWILVDAGSPTASCRSCRRSTGRSGRTA